ncbi:MAG: hypothetical protein VX833_00230 [Actinomycetota bacterium]|nr:hypothetical protein [Actinomycetota bacterium]
MNHALIAKEALRFRLGTLPLGASKTPALDTEEAGQLLAACGDPEVDRALRVLGETWQAAGLPSAGIDRPWTAGEAARLRSAGGAKLLDTLDELVTGITRCRIRP